MLPLMQFLLARPPSPAGNCKPLEFTPVDGGVLEEGRRLVRKILCSLILYSVVLGCRRELEATAQGRGLLYLLQGAAALS